VTLSIGQTLHNRYRIVDLVGQGGFGAVYRAWDTVLEQPVALKENTSEGSDTQRQFEREAKLLAGLRHPNLPRVIDHFVLPDQGQYLIMDFVEGKSLGTMLRERGAPFEEGDALQWVRQVSDALTYLHTHTPPIIHRDIKPDNIILTSDGRAMLVDFGISKIFDESKGTTTGARAVTHGYSPLEQYGRGKTDPRSDIYSLGATLYTLLTGLVPPDAPDLVNGTKTLLPPHLANQALSKTTSAAIMAAMSPSISQRIDSATGFQQLLPARASSPSYGTVIAPMTVGAHTVRFDASPSALLPEAMPSPVNSGAQRGPVNATDKLGVPIWGWLVGVVVLVALAAWAGVTFGGQKEGTADATPKVTAAPVVAAADTPQPTATDVAATVMAEPSPAAIVTTGPTATATVTTVPTATATATLQPTPTAEPRAGDVRTVLRGGVEVEQVFVPAGSFMMGSTDEFSDEHPVHEVTVDSFWIDRTEVTTAQYAAFVADTGWETAAERNGDTYTWWRPQGTGNNLDGLDKYPVVFITWEDAVAYATWASGRLPTEAEWEYAARGPRNLRYPWGNVFNGEILNYCDRNCSIQDRADTSIDDGYTFTAPVGTYPDGASWVHALDMAGNVWEWTNDWYDSGYYARSPGSNPPGPDSGSNKTLRGGAWNYTDRTTRAAYRYHLSPQARYYSVGFRVIEPLSDLHP